MQRKVLFARFPFGACDHPDVTDWLLKTFKTAGSDPRVSDVFHIALDDTPITKSRNQAVKVAREMAIDVLVMVDSDMSPDLPLPGAKPFWDSSFDFLCEHDGPCAIAAPYCGPPPHENVYVFKWATMESDHPNPDHHVETYGREEAALLSGIAPVAALPTGLIMIDCRAFDVLKPPYFYYEWTDETETEKASTEDVTFSRDLNLAGVPIYCNWDAWAGHWKRKRVGKPKLLTVDRVAGGLKRAFESRIDSADRVRIVKPGRLLRRAREHDSVAN